MLPDECGHYLTIRNRSVAMKKMNNFWSPELFSMNLYIYIFFHMLLDKLQQQIVRLR